MALQLRALGLQPETEHRFHPARRWRFDFAFPALRLGVEVEGGLYSRGRHVRPAGYEADLEKYNAAALAGWMVLRFSPAQVRSGQAASMIEEAVKQLRQASASA